MPSFAEIVRSLQGSVMLARRDTAGYGLFTMTADGFWRSFAAIVLVAPLYLAVTSLGGDGAAADLPEGARASPPAVFRLAVIAAEWVAYPAAMAFVTRLLGLQHRYVPYIIAYNWSSVPASAVVMPPILLLAGGLIGSDTTVTLFFFLSRPVHYYR